MKSTIKKFKLILDSRNNYDLFGSDNYENLHWGKLFIHLFGEYYSSYYVCYRVKVPELIEDLVKYYSLDSSMIIRIDKAADNLLKIDDDCSEVLLIVKLGFMISVTKTRIDLMYGSEISETQRKEVLQRITEFKIDSKKTRKFHMIQQSLNFFELTDFEIKPYTVDLETHYNDDFLYIHNLTRNSLMNQEKNGPILLHGIYGSGKTYYLRHLISNIDRKFIYFSAQYVSIFALLVIFSHGSWRDNFLFFDASFIQRRSSIR